MPPLCIHVDLRNSFKVTYDKVIYWWNAYSDWIKGILRVKFLGELMYFCRYQLCFCFDQDQLKVLVITTAQLHPTKTELRFCIGSNPAWGVSKIRDGEDLWQWLRLYRRLNALLWSTIPQKQFIIIIIITYWYWYWSENCSCYCGYSITVTFFFTKTENRTKKSLTQLSHHCFE